MATFVVLSARIMICQDCFTYFKCMFCHSTIEEDEACVASLERLVITYDCTCIVHLSIVRR